MANEKRLIDANAAIKAMNAVDIHFWDDAEDGVEKCVNILYIAPTVDAVEVVHGRWINKTKVIYGQEDVCYQCSHCETAYYYDAPERYNYCPNCGAKMDGDGNV